jgi:hypothetical protein
MREEMKHADGHAADAEPQHHVAQLRNRRVSEDALDVRLRNGDERGENGSDGADPGDGGKRRRQGRRMV